MSRQWHSETHGTCTLSGVHPEGSVYAKDCPVLRQRWVIKPDTSGETLEAPNSDFVEAPRPARGRPRLSPEERAKRAKDRKGHRRTK